MRLGLALPHYPFSFAAASNEPVARRALAYAQRAEELGFHQVWVSDHLFLNVAPTDKPEQREVPAECWTLLAAIAATTSRIRIGSLASPVGFRNPHLFARMVATVDQLSSRRLDVTLGAGWNEAEYRESGIAFGSAAVRLEALVEALQRLREQSAGVPVWVGGKRPRLLDIAATADGWNTAWDCTMAEYQRRQEALARACRRRGRDPNSIRRTVGLTTLIGRDADDIARRWRALQGWAPGGALNGVGLREWARTRLVGTPQEIRGHLDDWRRSGVEQIVLSCGAPFALWEDCQWDLAAEVVGSP
jgi:alkanesulfonate monooxygenase SsuD/methylene tetrahydromethanopterin reductase-like flavin-dependent oxidoreductase (luciferase family)